MQENYAGFLGLSLLPRCTITWNLRANLWFSSLAVESLAQRLLSPFFMHDACPSPSSQTIDRRNDHA